ncbi:MAG: tetratricopeptide repeat protein [Vicinamibacteria bacterium]|nr:tetratricopeptide repeat protein [Vicinamibacteria bacterium]
MKRLSLVLFAVALAAPLQAQDWKGMGRLFGKVTDATDNKPIAGASVKLDCPSRGGGTTLTTDKKGSWAFQGLAACNWNVDIKADGYQVKSITVPMTSEQARMAPVDLKLDKAKGPPPELVEALKAGDAAFTAQQWPVARENYEKVATMRPDLAPQLYPRLARIYGAEKNTEKALEYLQKAIDLDPSNQQMKLVAANAAMDAGLTDKALVFLATIDDAKITNGDGYFDLAVGFLRRNDSANAVEYFTKSVAKDPKIVEAYYWRGVAYLQQQKMAEAKADMQKVIELDPSGPNGEKAKKALEQMK